MSGSDEPLADDGPTEADAHRSLGGAAWQQPGGDGGLFDPEAGAPGGLDNAPGRLKKSATAFRTISEVADELHVPQHVLRFWETRFPQVKPLKRGGGRRYYRPDDVGLLRRIADLLYIQGYTIKGVQRLLRDGDGTLQGELPPPDVADQDGDDLPPARADHGGFETLPSQPGSVPSPGQDHGGQHAASSVPAGGVRAGAGDPAQVERQARELERLRVALGMVLAELESLRRQLPV